MSPNVTPPTSISLPKDSSAKETENSSSTPQTPTQTASPNKRRSEGKARGFSLQKEWNKLATKIGNKAQNGMTDIAMNSMKDLKNIGVIGQKQLDEAEQLISKYQTPNESPKSEVPESSAQNNTGNLFSADLLNTMNNLGLFGQQQVDDSKKELKKDEQSNGGPQDNGPESTQQKQQDSDPIVPQQPKPKTTDEQTPLDSEATHLVQGVQDLLAALASTMVPAGPNDPPADMKAALTQSLTAMKDSSLLGEALSPQDKEVIDAHLAKLNRTDGQEPTAEELGQALALQKALTQGLAASVLGSLGTAIEQIPDEGKRNAVLEKMDKELSHELKLLMDVAEGKPLYAPPPFPPPKDNQKTPIDNKTQTPSGKDETPKTPDDQQKETIKPEDFAAQFMQAMQMFFEMLKSMRKWILENLI